MPKISTLDLDSAALSGGIRLGVDKSTPNLEAARERFANVPGLSFELGDFRALDLGHFDAVVLFDVFEHVPDDAGFLAGPARLGGRVLVNLPLKDNWLNRRRSYGPSDISGQLRAYGRAEGLALIDRAGLRMVRWKQIWVHETPAEPARRALWSERTWRAYTSRWPVALVKRLVFATATVIRPIGRRLFASNLFAAARRRSA